ncbi:hypothetical protein A1O1_08139 [Capronia coronata CBS 617.96]|uniref:Vacuolar protein sorting-associated protein 62 n=1 Tax=Capronia coronata CBS 617.96 TaxID=1182541 RepID=W9XXH9_9EURO|nr:uncharacterized protein A1O1_08139 [Capronia coronata CBS 617.96]EXJ82070.1 hypothetical protein A1O1_08139 [Capronia coronata CBS 617.96]
MPSDILGHVLHTRPFRGFDPIPDVPPLDLDNLSSLNKYGKEIYLTSIDNVTTNPSWLLGETPDATGALRNSTACAVVVVERSHQQVDAFYFYFYSFNEGADITQVVPPLDRIFPDASPGNHFGDHVGDWEHNMIRFKEGKPTGIYFSQHGSGQACKWDDETCFSKQGERPVVFSARGSHANYPSAGQALPLGRSHIHDEALVDIADKGRIWDPVQPAYFYQYDPATDVLTPADPGTYPTDWFHFTGAWGDKKYNDSDPRQVTVPYFGLKKYENGPTGPKCKHLVRKGLMPDERPKPNMMKVLVGWYLSLYGCCLKGHSAWVVIIFTLVALAATIFVMVLTIKKVGPTLRRRLRRRRGEKGSAELNIPLLDVERAED